MAGEWAELNKARAAAEAAVKRATDAAERASRAGSRVAAHMADEAVQNATSATSRFEHITKKVMDKAEELRQEGVRRISSIGSIRPPEQEIEDQALIGARGWARGVRAASKSKGGPSSVVSRRSPGGRFLSGK
jgi:hypothetical protein